MVRKNFDRDIYYIGGGTKFTYWNVFPNEEKCFTEVGTYDAALTVEEQSYITVRNPFWANSHIYFCKYCTDTVNLQKIHINKKINVLFYVCPPCASQENIKLKRTFGRLPMMINREYVCRSFGTHTRLQIKFNVTKFGHYK